MPLATHFDAKAPPAAPAVDRAMMRVRSTPAAYVHRLMEVMQVSLPPHPPAQEAQTWTRVRTWGVRCMEGRALPANTAALEVHAAARLPYVIPPNLHGVADGRPGQVPPVPGLPYVKALCTWTSTVPGPCLCAHRVPLDPSRPCPVFVDSSWMSALPRPFRPSSRQTSTKLLTVDQGKASRPLDFPTSKPCVRGLQPSLAPAFARFTYSWTLLARAPVFVDLRGRLRPWTPGGASCGAGGHDRGDGRHGGARDAAGRGQGTRASRRAVGAIIAHRSLKSWGPQRRMT